MILLYFYCFVNQFLILKNVGAINSTLKFLIIYMSLVRNSNNQIHEKQQNITAISPSAFLCYNIN